MGWDCFFPVFQFPRVGFYMGNFSGRDHFFVVARFPCRFGFCFWLFQMGVSYYSLARRWGYFGVLAILGLVRFPGGAFLVLAF